jgi:hypothetical protein
MAHSHSHSGSRSYPLWCLAGLAFVFFVLGFFGFRESKHHHGVADSLYRSMQMLHLHFHWDHDEKGDGPVMPLTLQIARFGSGTIALAILPLLLGFVFSGRVRRWWVLKTWRGHVVVVGHCTRSLSLLEDLHRQRRRVVFIGRCPDGMHVPADVVHVASSAHLVDLLSGVAIHRATDLIALNEEDRANIEILHAAAIACRGKSGVQITCHAHLRDNHLGIGLHRLLMQGLPAAPGMKVRFFNYYEAVARLLTSQYPVPPAVVRIAEGQLPPTDHVVIVGFGAFGQCVALKILKVGQQILHGANAAGAETWGVQKPRITVVDRRGDICAHAFRRAHPNLDQLCEFRVVEAECESRRFLELEFLDAKNAAAHTSVVFCIEDEQVALRSVLLIQDIARSAAKDIEMIYVRVARPDNLRQILDSVARDSVKPKLVFFAPDDQVFSVDNLLRQRLDVLARGCHEAYLEVEQRDRRAGNPATAQGKSWNELSEEDRDGSREAADHLWAKLRTLGYRLEIVKDGEPTPLAPDELVASLRANEEVFARAEHYRWMTKRVLDGWQYGRERDNAQKLHPDLVPYEQLAESTKDKDRVNVRCIPKLLAAGRLRATRVEAERPA